MATSTTCKPCSKDMAEEHKKRTAKTVSSIHSTLFEQFELASQLSGCSKEKIHQTLGEQCKPEYVCYSCHYTVKSTHNYTVSGTASTEVVEYERQ